MEKGICLEEEIGQKTLARSAFPSANPWKGRRDQSNMSPISLKSALHFCSPRHLEKHRPNCPMCITFEFHLWSEGNGALDPPDPWKQNEASHWGPNWTKRGKFWFGFWEVCNTGHKNFPRGKYEQLHCSSLVLVLGNYNGNWRIPLCMLLQKGTEQYLWVYSWTFFPPGSD